ncbi:MAG: PKD domain-containing protein [Dysgonomonas sp.]
MFKAEADTNNYAPAVYHIANLSSGGSTYQWTFEGGEPSSYDGQNPPNITYANQGTYTIHLTADNGSAIFTSEQEITVREPLDASFSIIPSFEDVDDMQAPLRASFDTQLQGVETLRWECSGAILTNNTSADAGIYFPVAGQYTVSLNVSNGKQTKQVSQDITVKANTNLRTHQDVKFGINTASQTIGSLYSTKLRRIFKTSEVDGSNGASIDIAFFGLNADFTYNRFVSPDKLDETPLPEIPNAVSTKFINKTELGSVSLTPGQFNTMTTDALLRDKQISTVSYGDEFFTAAPLPRVVLFETQDGRKGAILIKRLVNSGKEDSYILTDIKIQKND